MVLTQFFGKQLQSFAHDLGIEAPAVYAASKEVSHEGQGLTAVEKIFNRNAVGVNSDAPLHAGSDVRVKVNIVGSQDTTGPMTCQELSQWRHRLFHLLLTVHISLVVTRRQYGTESTG